MPKTTGNRPAEIFGFPIGNKSGEAEDVRRQYWCPFVNAVCNKKSRLIDYPFGVCSAERHGEIYTVCPRRFEEPGMVEGTPRVLEDIASHYFGDLTNVISFSQVRLLKVGTTPSTFSPRWPALASPQPTSSLRRWTPTCWRPTN